MAATEFRATAAAAGVPAAPPEERAPRAPASAPSSSADPTGVVAMLAAHSNALLGLTEADVSVWLDLLGSQPRTVLHLSACEDVHRRAAEAGPALAGAKEHEGVWSGALEVARAGLLARREALLAVSRHVEALERALAERQGTLLQRARMRVARDLQAASRATAALREEAAPSQRVAAREATAELERLRAPADDATLTGTVEQARVAPAALSMLAQGVSYADRIDATARTLLDEVEAQVRAQLTRMRTLVVVEAEEMRAQASHQQLSALALERAQAAIARWRAPDAAAARSASVRDVAESARLACVGGGTQAGYESVVSSAGRAEALCACAASSSAALSRLS